MRLVAFLATLLLIAQGVVSAQSSSGGALGGVLDKLGGIIGIGGGRVHGNVVLTRGDTIIVRTDDGRTLAIEASGTDPRIRGLLKNGDGVTVTMRQPREGEPRSQNLTASDLQLDPPSQAGKQFQRADGTVGEMQQSRVMFKTREGFSLPLDVSTITGLPQLASGQPATLFYEQGKQGVVAVWIEPGSAPQAAGSPPIGQTPGGTPTGQAPPSSPLPGQQPPAPSQPSASPDTGAQRYHGVVDSVAMNGFTLASDDGRKLTVEGNSGDLRPGDMVTVFGRPAGGRTDAIVADSVQPDPR
jgi:hypothetical protein